MGAERARWSSLSEVSGKSHEFESHASLFSIDRSDRHLTDITDKTDIADFNSDRRRTPV